MSTRFFVALVTAFILFPILGFHRAEGQINPGPKLVEGAKKEGEMIFYTTMTVYTALKGWYGFITISSNFVSRRANTVHRRQECPD